MNQIQKLPKLTAKQKTMLLVLPVVVLPFIIFLFWSLGGGKGNEQVSIPLKAGLNTQLPDANLKNDSTENKLSFYAQAEKDSARLKEQLREDPYRHNSSAVDSAAGQTLMDITQPSAGTGYSLAPNGNRTGDLNSKEAMITRQLAALNQEISRTEQSQNTPPDALDANPQAQGFPPQGQSGSTTDDPELKQLSGMLDQIMDIQNPGRAAQKLKEQSLKGRGQVFAMTAQPANDAASTVMGNTTSQTGNHFYDLSNETGVDDTLRPSVPATVYQTQTLTSGTTIRLRLSADIFINGAQIPQGTFVNGICEVEGDRLNIIIKTIRYKNVLLPVAMSVYDMDGIEGINVPGAITRDAAKQGADQMMQNLDFYSMNSSVGAQATSAGLQAVKGLFSRKVKLVKVTVRAGYPVLLMDHNKDDK
ncbi:conjugative transposon protein TraM [Mucilaginibacter sp. Mucisp86]|uniref:conjugative transposon protein TraM n=1 Tax=Mucilaginibacter sp. Mucisp86 TaxID=3243060 RepID=UPI0039B5B4E2